MKDYHINIFYSEEDRGYIADVPDLEACSAFGATPEEALREVQIAKAAGPGRGEKMKDSAKYAKIVEWSEEDQCYIGSAPGLVLGGCHGEDEKKVFDELCQIVEEAIMLYRKDKKPLPPPTSGRDFANRMQDVA